jgi:uncharacterized protein involved in type VI secretion and phage assembly
MSRFQHYFGDPHAKKLIGIYLAIVAANTEQGEDSRYRVKLRFPWIQSDSSEGTHWARIAVPMAGAGRGTYFLPDVGTQVFVVFEHGHITRPIVIGAMQIGNGQPPERNTDGKNSIQVIKSRNGHRLIFDDTVGAERVILCDSTRRNKIVLDSATDTVTVQSIDGDIEIRAPSGAVRLHGKNVHVTTTGKIQGRGGKKLQITTRGPLNARASGALKLQGVNVQLKPGGSGPRSVVAGDAGSEDKKTPH